MGYPSKVGSFYVAPLSRVVVKKVITTLESGTTLKQTFRTYNSDQKIYISDINTTTYPDVSVVVGEVEEVGKERQ